MAGIIERLGDRVSKEWHVIEQAKGVFGIAATFLVCATAFVTWNVAGIFYAERIATKDSTISYLQSKISPGDRPDVRNLTPDQRRRMDPILRLGPNENYDFQVNSAAGCDECEQFAENIRDFLNSIPGWKTEGGPLMFLQVTRRRGLSMLIRSSEKQVPPVERLRKAFDSAGLRLNEEVVDDMPPGRFVIIVGRAGP